MSPHSDGTDAGGLSRAIERLPIVMELMQMKMDNLPVDFLGANERDSLVKAVADGFSKRSAAPRFAVAGNSFGSDQDSSRLHEWTAPLIDLQAALPDKLDEAADALRAQETS